MSTFQKLLVGLLSLVIVILLFFSPSSSLRTNFGSVSFGNEYQSTTTSPTSGLTSFSATTGAYKVLQTGSGTLGSVVVTLGSNAPLRIYDATSTVTNTQWATTTLADFKTTATAGTYTFDVIFQKGLLVETVSTVGIASTTITYR